MLLVSFNTYVPLAHEQECKKIPTQEIIDIFNKSFPELPSVKIVSDKRKQIIRSRWHQNSKMQTIGEWERFFNYIRQSDFLMGRTTNSWGGLCFDWIFNSTNFAKIYEGNYDNKNKIEVYS